MTSDIKTIDAPKLEFKDLQFDVKEVTKKGEFSGYGSIFGEKDFGDDIVAQGAFSRSLAETKAKGRKIPALWSHNSREPIGVYDEIKEDGVGLYVEGRLLIDSVQRAKETHALMLEKVVSGLSIGYGTRKFSMDTETYVRTLLDVDLFEVSPVTFPMLDTARISDVKHRIREGDLPSLKDFEDFLRESGFSKSQATAIAGKGLAPLLRSESVTPEQAKTLDVLKSFSLK